MGVALFEVRGIVEANKVAVCSANFALYGDLSSRVHATLGTFTDQLDVYSIDEAFLDLAGVPTFDRGDYATSIRSTVRKHTGITVSIGVAPTKTLAKAAAEKAKHLPEGVFVLRDGDDTEQLLHEMAVEDIWGIGSRRGILLRRYGIQTAWDFANADTNWVRRHLTVMGQRTQLELRGISCLPLVTVCSPRKQVCCSRSFGKDVTSLQDLKEAVAQYGSWGVERVRSQHTCATTLMVFLATNSFRKEQRQYHQSCAVSLPRATNDTMEIVGAAISALKRIYRKGYAYHKAGVILTDMVPEEPTQLTLLDEGNTPERRELMEIMDKINDRFGHDTIKVAATGLAQPWRMKQKNKSPRYTTRWGELAHVR
jgi:DNA polymerase V